MSSQSKEPKVAIITGASTGLGKATALLFAEKGIHIAICSKGKDAEADKAEKEALDAVIASIKKYNVDGYAMICDVSDPAAVESFINNTVNKFGRLDYGVNNAAVTGPQRPVNEYTPEEWDLVQNVNLKGVWLCMKYQINQMLKNNTAEHEGSRLIKDGDLVETINGQQIITEDGLIDRDVIIANNKPVKARGVIVNISSTSGLVGLDYGFASYSASKHGVIGLTKSAALEYAKKGIRINAVAPGPMLTEMYVNNYMNGAKKKGKEPKEVLKEHLLKNPMNHMSNPVEVAQAIYWLCTDEASFVAGVTLPVDGGRVAR